MSEELERLQLAVKLSYPVINIVTIESGRASMVMEEVAAEAGKAFLEMKFQAVPSQPELEKLKKEAEDAFAKSHETAAKGVVVFDPFFLDRQRVNPETIPALRSSVFYLENHGMNYVVASRDAMTEEAAYHVRLPALGEEEAIELIRTCERYIDEEAIFSDDERKLLANHAKGLSHTQLKNLFTSCAYLKSQGKPYLEEIRAEKKNLLRDVGLEVIEPVALADVGGMEHLKDFLHVRRSGWDKGMPIKGILLAGPPGGGKTLVAKSCASVFGTSLIRLDIGRFYSKYLGDTETRFERALETVDAIAPVVVLIDEIEKYLGVNENDHAVSRRLLANFLYWLQERKSRVFVVATANRVSALPPELMRAGRWDRAFFIDLPNEEERAKIFEIHLRKQIGSAEGIEIALLVARSDGYTGAEIEQSIIDASYLANADDCPVETSHLIDGLSRITPTIKMRAEEIEAIRSLRTKGFYPANEYQADERTRSARLVAT